MNQFFSIVVFFSVNVMPLLAGESAVNILTNNFKKIEVAEGNLSITMNDIGNRYVFETDGKEGDFGSEVVRYGETVTLKRGFKKAKFYNSSVGISISKSEKMENSYEMRISLNDISTSGGFTEIKTYFFINENSIEDVMTSGKSNFDVLKYKVNKTGENVLLSHQAHPPLNKAYLEIPAEMKAQKRKYLNQESFPLIIWIMIAILIFAAGGLLFFFFKRRL